MNNYSYYLQTFGEYGEVNHISYPIVSVTGLPSVRAREIVVFETGELGQVLWLNENTADVILFANTKIAIGTKVSRTGSQLAVPVGQAILGQVINPLGQIYATGHPIVDAKEYHVIDKAPLGIRERLRITEQLLTGTSLVDMTIPLGKGQKELILGDRKSGKTTFALTALKHQLEEGAIAVYAAIGKKKSDIKFLEAFMEELPEKSRMLIVSSSSFDSAGLIYLTPFTAMTIAEYFRDRGENVILVLDDLLSHAKFYREFSLLAQVFPGRDSYPGDIFHIHAKLLERAGNFRHTQKGSVSLSCLPIAETQESDLTGYIVSNLMSITDGHLFFDNNIFSQGRRPAIHIGLSVTRVGKQTQSHLVRDVNRELSSFFSIYERVENLSHFSAELNDSVKSILATGERIFTFFNQPAGLIVPLPVSLLLFALVWLNAIPNGAAGIDEARDKALHAYQQESAKKYIDSLLSATTLNGLLSNVGRNKEEIFKLLK
jgi:F-type H+-transporting ATPase subunit alpha